MKKGPRAGTTVQCGQDLTLEHCERVTVVSTAFLLQREGSMDL